MADSPNVFTAIVIKVRELLKNFLKTQEEIRAEAKQIVTDAIAKSDAEKMQNIKDKIAKL